MHFSKKLQYLGAQQNTISTDNSVYYAVSFFDPNTAAPVQVNVMGNNSDVISVLSALDFGVLVDVQFVLRPKDKLYRLGLVSVSKVK